MAAIFLKLSDELAEESARYAGELKLSRSEYIRRAVEEKNRKTQARLRARRLAEASRKVRKESMRINAEFSGIERDPDA